MVVVGVVLPVFLLCLCDVFLTVRGRRGRRRGDVLRWVVQVT